MLFYLELFMFFSAQLNNGFLCKFERRKWQRQQLETSSEAA
jgi:hypothetical protein